MELGQIATAKIPASEAITPTQVYPMYEELVLRANIASEAEGMEGLACIQALVNTLGLPTIIKVVRAIEKNPALLQQAMPYLPLIIGQ